MASYFSKYATAKNETQKSDFQLRVNHSRDVRECNCLETHTPRNGHTLSPSECDDYAAVCDNAAMKRCPAQKKKKKITHFVKFVTTVFPLRVAEGMLLSVTPHGPHQSRTHRGIERTVTTNSSVKQFFAAPSKPANLKAVSVTRADVMLCVCELIVEQNIPLSPMTR